MKLKSLVAAAAMLVAGAASAAPISFGGMVLVPGAFTLNLGSVVVAPGFSTNVYGGVSSSPFTVTTSTPAGPMTLSFSALTLSSASMGASVDTDLSNGFSFLGLTAGTYTLSVSGTAVTGGYYAGAYDSVSTPVPEAGSMALALAGLGVAGLMLRRRSPV